MLFNSYAFLLFFPVVCILYFTLPQKLRNPWLMLCSYFFYGLWNFAYLGLIFFSTATTYACSLIIGSLQQRGREGDRRLMKQAIAINLLINLGILFMFKYYNLFSQTMGGIGIAMPSLNLLLPVGISFFTFQSLGYTIDVYRGQIKVERNFMTYALFVSFFPQLVAGPIERAGNLLPQFHVQHRYSFENMRKGLLIMLWGFFLKVVLADRAAILVNHIYNTQTSTGFQYLIGTLVFGFQIYGDFAGYSMIAMGAAQVLGFTLMRNFRQPYLSQSVGEFWRRWHISLSDWFRDYLYFPLGGSRRGTARTLLNIMVVFLLSGLWHGAAYTFVLWGFLNGIYQVAERLLHIAVHRRSNGWAGLIRVALTFTLITLAWVPFRAASIEQALAIYGKLFSADVLPRLSDVVGQTNAVFGMGKYEVLALAASIIAVAVADMLEARNPGLIDRAERLPAWKRWPIYYALLFAVLIFGIYGSAAGPAAFIYFQF